MAKFNIYKIRKGEESNLLERFQKVGLNEQKSEIINDYKLTFFFSINPDEVNIWWIDFYNHFLSESQLNFKNRIYYGVLLVQKESTTFAVSLSKSHFYIKDYCDVDFGLDLAERIANEKDVKIKNTRFFKSKKNKVITSYQNDSSIDFESGESMHFLKARSIDSKKWGKTVNFGQSVLFVFDADYTRLPMLIDDIREELLKKPRINLPKVIYIDNEKEIERLNVKLISEINDKDGDSSVEEQQFVLNGVDFVFSDEYEYSFFVAGHSGDKSKKGPLTMERFREFLKEKSIEITEYLDNIKITVHKEQGRDHSENFKNYLEYIDGKERVCLIDGKWYRFNQSYINYLKQEVDNIICDIEIHGEKMPVELDFISIQEKIGFTVIHKSLKTIDKKYSVEDGDMIKDHTLYIVKKGQPKQLNYAIDQAICSINYLQENKHKIDYNGVIYDVKEVKLILLIERKTDLKNLFDINSLIFHMKLIDWQRMAKNARIIPSVKIEQYKIKLQ